MLSFLLPFGSSYGLFLQFIFAFFCYFFFFIFIMYLALPPPPSSLKYIIKVTFFPALTGLEVMLTSFSFPPKKEKLFLFFSPNSCSLPYVIIIITSNVLLQTTDVIPPLPPPPYKCLLHLICLEFCCDGISPLLFSTGFWLYFYCFSPFVFLYIFSVYYVGSYVLSRSSRRPTHCSSKVNAFSEQQQFPLLSVPFSL